uniref:non-ribosomal peptide synthetase n=1 Tax=Bacillus cereus TaxID=1396 RepID=UPI001374D320
MSNIGDKCESVVRRSGSYWKEYLQGKLSGWQLLSNYKKPLQYKYKEDSFLFDFNSVINQKINLHSKQQKYTNFQIMLTAYQILLYRYSKQNDFLIGISQGENKYLDIKLNKSLLPLRVTEIGQLTIRELLQKTQESVTDHLWYQEILRENLMRDNLFSDLENSFSKVYFTYSNNIQMLGDSYVINPINPPYLLFHISNIENNVKGRVSFNSNIFDQLQIRQMVAHFTKIVESILDNRDLLINDINILTEDEEHQILYEFNNTKKYYPSHKTLQQLFEEQAEKSPENIAVVYKEQYITYQELNERANQVAHILRNKGIEKEKVVAIMVERSAEMVVGVLGVLKAGGTYLPIDPKYPNERIEYMLSDSKSCIVLTQVHLAERLNCEQIILDSQKLDLLSGEFSNPEGITQPNDLAYVIYTSGSTGRPKGVMVEQHSVINLCFWAQNFFRISDKDISGQYVGFGFDPWALEVFPYILKGATLHIIPDEIRYDIYELNNYYEKNRISISALPTPVCEQFMELENNSLRALITGGDQLRKYKKNNYKLFNNYGPTEHTVVTTNGEVNELDGNISIGKPIDNTEVYILDEKESLQPIGIPGELCISGAGTARGYWNNKGLTQEKFVINPYKPGRLMYRTGDMARWLPDGNIQFMGRMDRQIKIRGYRIELDEIESYLLNYKGIEKATVTAKESEIGGKYLVAYIITDPSFEINQLKSEMRKYFPEYMIPTHFVKMDTFPLTVHGKIDRESLPEPDQEILELERNYEVANNALEKKLIEIWQEVLLIKKIGVQDDFFLLGGHSLTAMLLLSRIQKELGLKVSLKQLFAKPTIRSIANLMYESSNYNFENIQSVEERSYYVTSSAQKRIYTLSQYGNDNTTYNIPNVLNFQGELDVAKLEISLRTLINRHEVLRTSFVTKDGEILQKVHDEVPFNIEIIPKDIDNQYEKTDFIRPFDLSEAPLMRVGLTELEQNRYVFMLDIHHIIADGVSIGIFMKELMELYYENELPALKLQYKDYAEWQQEFIQSEAIQMQKEYWTNRFKDGVPVVELPTDYMRPSVQSFEGDSVFFDIDVTLTKKLKQICQENGVTLYMALISIYQIWLSKYTGQEDVMVGTVTAGRHNTDLYQVMGMFVNTLALRGNPKGGKTFGQFLQETKENTLEAFENQDYQFEELIEELKIPRETSRNPLFDTMFVLENIDTLEFENEKLRVSLDTFNHQKSKFDLTLIGREYNSKLFFQWEFATQLYKKETIERYKKHFIQILKEILNNPDQKIADIKMITEIEHHKILNDFNNTKTEYPKEKT